MHRKKNSRLLLFSAVFTLWMVGCRDNDKADVKAQWVEFPADDHRIGSMEPDAAYAPHTVHLESFAIRATETTVAEYCDYLNSTASAPQNKHPQIAWQDKQRRPLPGQESKPITHCAHAEAVAYCDWLSDRLETVVRLPTEREWEAAARGGICGGRYPWGWGEPVGRAQFAAESSCRVGAYPSNPAGLYDMAGNVFEYCLSTDRANGKAKVRGGSWAEDDSNLLRVYRTTLVEKGYRGPDVGFRPVKIPLD